MRRIFAGVAGLAILAEIAVLPVTADAEPQRGGTLIYAVTTGEPANFDCHGAGTNAVLYRVAPHYSTLLKINTANYPEIVGDVAQSWTVSEDWLTYRFVLYPNIRFHDGSALTSADVKATYDRIRNPPSGVISVRKELYRDIESIETPDDQTVVFHLSQPNSAMLSLFANPWNCLYSAKQLARDQNFPLRNILGTGPFRFVRYVAGSEWIGERFDGYFRAGHPFLDGFRAVSFAPTAAVNALSTGQAVAMFQGVGGPNELARIKEARGDQVRTAIVPQTTLLMVRVNTERKPFDDERVRRALNIAIDRWGGAQALAKAFAFSAVGGLTPPGSPFAASRSVLELLPGYSSDMAANRSEARRLLAEAGQQNLKFTFLNRPIYANLGIFLIDQWRQIGVTVTQEMPENAQFFASSVNGNFDLALDANQDFIDDPTLEFAPFLSIARNPANYSRSTDSRVDELYDSQARTTDPEQRKIIVRQLEKYLLERAYSIPLFWLNKYFSLDASVKGYSVTPSNLLGQDLADVWLER